MSNGANQRNDTATTKIAIKNNLEPERIVLISSSESILTLRKKVLSPNMMHFYGQTPLDQFHNYHESDLWTYWTFLFLLTVILKNSLHYGWLVVWKQYFSIPTICNDREVQKYVFLLWFYTSTLRVFWTVFWNIFCDIFLQFFLI